MKEDYTHVCVILDASGSMESIANDTRGSFDSFVKDQQKEGGKTIFDLFQFSDSTDRIVQSLDIASLPTDLMEKYQCLGMTALNDAVCTAIDTLGKEFREMPEEERPETVVVAIITDGEENSSRKFSHQDVRDRIKRQTDVYNWQFVFIGAGIDGFAAGQQYGLTRDCCETVAHTADGMACMNLMLNGRVNERRDNMRRLRENRDEENK